MVAVVRGGSRDLPQSSLTLDRIFARAFELFRQLENSDDFRWVSPEQLCISIQNASVAEIPVRKRILRLV